MERVVERAQARVRRRAAAPAAPMTTAVAPVDAEPEAAQTASMEGSDTQRDARAAPDLMPAASSAAPQASAPDAPNTPNAAASGTPTLTRVGYAPIVRVDAARREIELCATSEAVDSYGTVFDYAASKAAFARWIGNVREMHERRAVGRRVAVRCDDDARRVYVRVRISTGAQDTWEKIGDGTLRGASIGASNVIWTFQTRRVADRDQVVQVATAYELVELSLVDNPSNPDALGITIVRAAEPVEALLAELEDPTVDGGTEGTGPLGGERRTANAELAELAELRGARGASRRRRAICHSGNGGNGGQGELGGKSNRRGR
jgi:phage head maturation protease